MAAEIGPSSDQKKLIAAVGLVVVALIALWWTFVGFGAVPNHQCATMGVSRPRLLTGADKK
jgi:hypothetical protein